MIGKEAQSIHVIRESLLSPACESTFYAGFSFLLFYPLLLCSLWTRSLMSHATTERLASPSFPIIVRTVLALGLTAQRRGQHCCSQILDRPCHTAAACCGTHRAKAKHRRTAAQQYIFIRKSKLRKTFWFVVCNVSAERLELLVRRTTLPVQSNRRHETSSRGAGGRARRWAATQRRAGKECHSVLAHFQLQAVPWVIGISVPRRMTNAGGTPIAIVTHTSFWQ